MAKVESATDRAGAAYALWVLFAINAINFFDRQIGGVLAEPIRKEWGLSDTQVGWLVTAFTLLYAAVGVPLGRLADRSNRSRILAAGVFFWSLMTAASGLTRNFAQLFLVRLGVGVGEATCAPASASLIGDLYPPQGRAKAMSVFMMGLPIGIALSLPGQQPGRREVRLAAGLLRGGNPGAPVRARGIGPPRTGTGGERDPRERRRAKARWFALSPGPRHADDVLADRLRRIT